MTDIAAFLAACVDDDERGALAAGATRSGKIASWRVACDCGAIHADGCYECRVEGDNITIYDEGGHDEDQARHIARYDPVRALVEVGARRRILAEVIPSVIDGESSFQDENDIGDDGYDWHQTSALLLRLLAAPYAHRPGYREEWRP